MSHFEYNFWQCGHITDIHDGIQVSENGNLTIPALANVPRSTIQKQHHSLCPRCHADRLISRLKDIKTLLSDCILRREEAELDERKFTAIKNFMLYDSQERFVISTSKWADYPEELLRSECHTLQLELEVSDILISDYASASSRRLRAKTAQVFVDRVMQIGKEAASRAKALRGKDGQEGMKKCLLDIMLEAKRLVEEIETAEESEASYLKDLEARAADLRIVLKGYDPKIGKRYNARTGRYSSNRLIPIV
ncbi:hypothetical protein F5Y08DRAFT_354864 [Xylaria arbuscula]|nr:hypothetical protein F5Y08DRAFT_354864 [Xylaria arbuscula]